MTNEEIEKIVVEQAKPLCVQYGCQISLQDAKDGKIKLKLACPPLDIFKVQGKIVKMEDELKKKILDRLEKAIKDSEITFI